jgi:hypothetical protein
MDETNYVNLALSLGLLLIGHVIVFLLFPGKD